MKVLYAALLTLLLTACSQYDEDRTTHMAASEIRVEPSEELELYDLLIELEESTAAAAPPMMVFGEVQPIMPNPDSILNQMFNVDMSFVIPLEANIADSLKAELIITPEDIEATIEHSIEGVPQEYVVLVTQIVRADLRTDDFEVTNITPIEQVLLKTESTQWMWKLKPINPGEAEVVLTVTAIVKTDLGNSQRQMKSFEKTIDIDITKKQIIIAFIEDNWQWLWSTILVPLGLFAYSLRRNKSSDNS